MEFIERDTLLDILQAHLNQEVVATHNGRMVVSDIGDGIAIAMRMVKEMPTASLNDLRDAIYEDAVAHGLWEDYDNFYADRVQNDALIVDKRYDCATSVHHE